MNSFTRINALCVYSDSHHTESSDLVDYCSWKRFDRKAESRICETE